MAKNIGEVRAVFPESLYRKDFSRWKMPLLRDAILFFGGFLLATLAPLPFSLLGAVFCGIGISAFFVLGHDAAHGTAFDVPEKNHRLAFWLFLPSLSPEPLWVLGHNRLHHGFTSLTERDWIWAPPTLEEFRAASLLGRANIIFSRHISGFWWYYLSQVWFPGMVKFEKWGWKNRKLQVLLFFVGWSLTAFLLGGFLGWIFGVLIPFLLFQQTIATVVYLNHTHPRTKFFFSKEGWNMVEAQLRNSVTWSSPLWNFLLHNILLHTPHHVDTRLPFYSLPNAVQILREKFPSDVVFDTFSWTKLYLYTQRCFLFSEEKGWISFSQALEFPETS